ncbi:uncharacterized protein PAC_03479 [Phialocephala subalpina]|uniref:Uncharacterized protein n=1 Tax=Phialocephala subalpina TaxID=576137 RepID=A0A1L7WLE8_9HELO|nr:uncharacterized protein PAC_03479 [Phialocephala subalpina]
MMFFPEYPVRAVAYRQAQIYVYENPEAFRQIHDHHTAKGRAAYTAEVEQCKARFPNGFPGATPALGRNYFITKLFLHVNGPVPTTNDPPVELGIPELKKDLEEIIGRAIQLAPSSAVIQRNLEIMNPSEVEEDHNVSNEEDDSCEHGCDHEPEADEEEQSEIEEERTPVGYMFGAEDEEQGQSGDDYDDENEEDDEYNPSSSKSKASRPAKASSSRAKSKPHKPGRIARGTAQVGIRLGLIDPNSVSTSQAAPHHTQIQQDYMETDGNGLVDLCYFPRCVRCEKQRRGFYCDRKFGCSKCAGKACVREPVSNRTASGYYGNRTNIMINPATYFP